ncbi:MAG: PsbP-related protein [bacterium]|jgi:hypothetical protein
MRKKQLIKFFILFIFIKLNLFYFCYSNENKNLDYKIYENKNYIFNYPKDWELMENLADLDIALINLKNPTANIYIKTIKNNQKIEEYIDNEIKKMQESLLEKFDILKNERQIIQDKEIYILEYQFTQGTLDFKTLRYYIIKPDKLYLLTYTNYKKDFENNLKDFYFIFNSFKIK